MQVGHMIWRGYIARSNNYSDLTFRPTFCELDSIANQINQDLANSGSIAQRPAYGVGTMNVQVKVDVGIRSFRLEHANYLPSHHLGLTHS